MVPLRTVSRAFGAFALAACSEDTWWVEGPDTSGMQSVIFLASQSSKIQGAVVSTDHAEFKLETRTEAEIFGAGFECAASALGLSAGPLLASPQSLPEPAKTWRAKTRGDKAKFEEEPLPTFVRDWLHVSASPCVSFDRSTVLLDDSRASITSVAATGARSFVATTRNGALFGVTVEASTIAVARAQVDTPALAVAASGEDIWLLAPGGLRRGQLGGAFTVVPGTESLEGSWMAATFAHGQLTMISETENTMKIHRYRSGEFRLLVEEERSADEHAPRMLALEDGRFAAISSWSNFVWLIDGDSATHSSQIPIHGDDWPDGIAELPDYGLVVGTVNGAMYVMTPTGDWAELRRGGEFLPSLIRAFAPLPEGGFIFGGGDGSIRQYHGTDVDCGRIVGGIVGLSDLQWLVPMGDDFAAVISYYGAPAAEAKNPEIQVYRRSSKRLDCHVAG